MTPTAPLQLPSPHTHTSAWATRFVNPVLLRDAGNSLGGMSFGREEFLRQRARCSSGQSSVPIRRVTVLGQSRGKTSRTSCHRPWWLSRSVSRDWGACSYLPVPSFWQLSRQRGVGKRGQAHRQAAAVQQGGAARPGSRPCPLGRAQKPREPDRGQPNHWATEILELEEDT